MHDSRLTTLDFPQARAGLAKTRSFLCLLVAVSLHGVLALPPACGADRSADSIPLRSALRASRRIDKRIAAQHAEHGVTPNPMTTDETFLRRIYLDVIGRIPTYEEAVEFLDSTDPKKRSKLIDALLDSEGYVSHQFNYWADLLRLQSRMRYAPAAPYLKFVKEFIRDNKPYDQFVRELVTAEGYTWDNGAAGYYLRDTGMPLDNMSNTAQVFLGTQLVCAQCHDHPFDSWTQRQYYQLAAFTYGIETRDRRTPQFVQLQQMRRSRSLDRDVLRSAAQILQPLSYRVHETDRPLRLPDDYQYSDAEPKTPISPATIFGDAVDVPANASRKEIYALWMASSSNPRFTTVIANRLWRKVMGRGLIEPVDDFKDGVDPTNPALMRLLARKMINLDFDLKQYYRMLYNTQTYQREVTKDELLDGEPYYFRGPLLSRMSAEQIWDSMLTLIVPELDDRPGSPARRSRYGDAAELVKKSMQEILAMARQQAVVRTQQFKYFQQTRDLQQQLRIASRTNDRDKVADLRQEMSKIRSQVFSSDAAMMMQRNQMRSGRSRQETDPRWRGFSRDLVRASEIESPARAGHFLQQFGQSDRETIENSNTDANVPQILTLLNGPIYTQILKRNSAFAKHLARAADDDEKLDVIFISILGRYPTPREKKLTLPLIRNDDRRGTRTSDVVWALLNTRQFLFVQ